MKKEAILGLAGLGLLAGGLGRELYVRNKIEKDMSKALIDKINKKKVNLNNLQNISPYVMIKEKKDPYTNKSYKEIKRKSSTTILPKTMALTGLTLLGINKIMELYLKGKI